MSSLWLVMFAVGLLTFLTRLSFILLQDKWQPPHILTRGLRFVPVAVLTAIFIPEILLAEGKIDFSFSNVRLLAGLIAILIAFKTKSALWTIAIGMGTFWLITWLI